MATEKDRMQIIGLRKWMLTIIAFKEMRKYASYWIAKCECGNEIVLNGNNFKRGNHKSCGCNRKKWKIKDSIKKHPLYTVWHGLKARCINEKTKNYHNYGGRGIKICERWMDYELFYKDLVSLYKEGHQLDRIENDGNYCLKNCQFLIRKESARKTRQAKLNLQKAEEIRKSNLSSRKLAAVYGVSHNTILSVKRNISWMPA